MRLPTLGLVVRLHEVILRPEDVVEGETDDLDLVELAVARAERIVAEPAGRQPLLLAAAAYAGEIARIQGFVEGNKRTAFLVAQWILDNNGLDGEVLVPPQDRQFNDVLIQASMGKRVVDRLYVILVSRAP